MESSSAAAPIAKCKLKATEGRSLLTILTALLGSLFVIGLLSMVVLAILLWPLIQAGRRVMQRTQAENRLKQLGIAIQNYHDTYGQFPPVAVYDADGKALYSGRVLLLHLLGQDAIYRSFDLSQAWDSPRNLPISEKMVPEFTHPTGSGVPGRTDFLFVTGKRTIFEQHLGYVRMADAVDGLSNTLLVVDVRNSGIHWAEPRDLDLSQPRSLPPSDDPGGSLAVFADASVRFIDSGMPQTAIRQWASRSDTLPVKGDF